MLQWQEMSDAWTESGALRIAVGRSYALLRERDRARLDAMICGDARELLDASCVRALSAEADRFVTLDSEELPAVASEMEVALLPRALAADKSLISVHPLLDPELNDLADRCRRQRVIVHLLLARAEQQTVGVYAAHWVGCDRPAYERRASFYYWDIASHALAAAAERDRIEAELVALRDTAYRDQLTGLPNAVALETELHRNEQTIPFSVLMLDFDGMREANAAFGYTAGGDALIACVGAALADLKRPAEFAARLHTAGDEFVMLLPGVHAEHAMARAAMVEAALDALPLEQRLRSVYHGASVGWASRIPGETPGQTLGRAVAAMRERKGVRSSSHR